MTARASIAAVLRRDFSVSDIPRPRLLAGAISLAALAAVLAPRMAAAGSPMDEGGVLAYADRILHGQLPLRDLHSFYGPLSTYLVAGAFKVFGSSLYVERAVGLAYRLVLAAALLGLARRRGPWAIGAAAIVLLWLLPSQGDAAFATYGALACSCVAILLADNRRSFAAGVAAGVAVLMRFDWVLPLALAGVPYLVAWRWRERRRLLAGAVIGVVPYAPYLASVSFEKVRVFLHGIRSGQAGRHLPLSIAPHGRGLIFDVALVSIAVLLAVGWKRRATDEGRALLSVALLGAGLLPYALDRADRQHVTVAAIAPAVLLAVAVPAAVGRRARVVALLLVVAVGARGAYLIATHQTAQALDIDVMSGSLDSASNAARVSHDGRFFFVASAGVARAARAAVDRADAIAPAHGALFVGPGDLNDTIYSDAYIYYLLPRLRAATFYITLDPGAANLRGERLVDQLPNADVLVLDEQYGTPGRKRVGADRILARDFCLRGTFQPFRVYARCGM